MPKTKEELQQYIHDYKSQALDDVNTESQKRFDLANQIDLKLGSQLITLSSAFMVVVGGFILTQNQNLDDFTKITLGAITVFLLVSIMAGLQNYRDIASFWVDIARYKHAEGKIIIDDNSKTYDDLVAFRNRLDDYRNKSPTRNKLLARSIQILTFIGGVFLLIAIIVIALFNQQCPLV